MVSTQEGLTQEDKERIWRHSVAVAVACEELARVTKRGRRDQAFTAGLLHDVGRAAIAYSELTLGGPPDAEDGECWIDRERSVCGADHDELGGLLLEKWKLPEELRLAVAHHSDPSDLDGPAGDLARLVHLAEVRCSGMGMAAFEEGREAPLCAEAAAALGLTGVDLARIWPRVTEQIEKAEALLKLRV
jgi:putative nucleotidyltransferase with HDIG domain